MGRKRVLREAGLLALTVNALRPLRNPWTSLPTFLAGWLTAELSPHLLAAEAAATLTGLARRGLRDRDDRVAAVLGGLSVAGLAALALSGRKAAAEVEAGLREALGEDYAEGLDHVPTRAELAVPWRQVLLPFRLADPTVVRRRDLPYAPGGRRFELDVYHHRDQGAKRPVLIQVHGGAWLTGRKDQQGIPLMLHLAANGWLCVSVNYPLSPKTRVDQQLVALKRAVAWVREHAAEYGGDPGFVAVTGGSAGGHLATMLALTGNDPRWQPGFEDADTSVQACAPHYGVYDLAAETETRAATVRLSLLLSRYVVGKDPRRYPELYRSLSPLAQVRADAPPFFVVHGAADTLVPVPEAREFVRRLRAVSTNPVAYAEISGAQHAFDVFPSIRSAHVLRGVARFLEWTSRNRP
ncbi:alpha/beta hydrolase [Actinokineospora sp. PR83]|uniref:alpha/beta hydrolase n=1 Tax=Actinokineospora sp. PR83 TaxID=2884908 RepID=UPI001F305E8E|nr:alpha/beta hydrolase [Actinokineospora sp. PR83]MCG8919894.1 alpha/beta hydrolase [Actinokineospora sp. PR83]